MHASSLLVGVMQLKAKRRLTYLIYQPQKTASKENLINILSHSLKATIKEEMFINIHKYVQTSSHANKQQQHKWKIHLYPNKT